MQTVLLIFIVLFALAIGFFLGLFLLSLDTPLTRSLTKKDDKSSPEEAPQGEDGALPEIRRPTPGSQLLLQVWKEEGKPPVYDLAGKYLTKEQLPKEIVQLISGPETAPQPPAAAGARPAPALDLPEIAEEEEEEEVKLLSVVDEVNNILQKKLIGSPLAGKGIHLMENFNKEIRFWVGLNSYDDVEDIPDPDVRQIINDSVREWEKNRA